MSTRQSTRKRTAPKRKRALKQAETQAHDDEPRVVGLEISPHGEPMLVLEKRPANKNAVA